MCQVQLRLRWGVLALVACLHQAGAGRADEALYRKVAASTALVYKNAGPYGMSSGTGFLVDAPARLVVTARHVVENVNGGLAPDIVVIFAQVKEGEIITDASYYRKNWNTLVLRSKVIYDSVRRDLAVLQLEKLPAGISALELAAARARPGQAVHVVGNSGEHFGGVFSYCRGYVRNAFRWEDLGARVVATHVPTNKGDSGGPMVNDRGQVVGFACWSTTGGTMPKGSSFQDVQVTCLGVCVSELRQALAEMRQQQRAGRQGPDRPQAAEKIVLGGEARTAVHFQLLEKDVLYRIRVKAKGFAPDVRVNQMLLRAETTSAPGAGGEWHYLFTAPETREYRIQIGHAPGFDLGKGPFSYTLAVDQVSFVPEVTLQAPRLELNEQVRKLEAGKVYRVMVKARGFEPDLQILEGPRSVMWRFNNGKRVNSGADGGLLAALGWGGPGEYETSLIFVPARTADYRILVDVSPFSPPGSDRLTYNLTLDELKPQLLVRGQLTPGEPRYPQAGAFKVHPCPMEAGKAYQIDMTTTAFAGYLVLEDAAGKVVAQGVDRHGLSDRLSFRPTRTGTYRIVASTRQPAASGPYLLTVVESPQAATPGGSPKGPKHSR